MKRWTPKVGDQARGVLKRSGLDKDNTACAAILQSASEILGSGVDPNSGDGRATGLVVGYVQSGKTLSFTTVIGLARDNGFPLVIVVAGNKTSLLNQSHDRLKKDLDVDGGDDGLPDWIMAQNPRAQDAQYADFIHRAIEAWNDDSRDPDEKPTIVLTVLKQNQRLAALTNLLRSMDLRGVPTLIVDDEADQASLNTKVGRGGESTTYTRLRELRDAVPCHLFVQYTATPQAPLLINIADILSPDFVHVLEPGQGYVGGQVFFAPGSRYVETIPDGDIAVIQQGGDAPPESLHRAMRLFFVGLASSIYRKASPRRRSMLIHPSRLKAFHQESAEWAKQAKETWRTALTSNDPDKADVIEAFRAAYEEVAQTAGELASFDEILPKLPRALRNTTVIEFNTRGEPKTPEIAWRNSDGWILVGGQAVDRGFTVDSLSVTYMPRGTGVGNADTLQQRARFFGYKRPYLGECRVYLEPDLRDAFEDYVEHEQIMRGELLRVAQKGTELRNWRRRLVLDPSLRPCRQSVISDPLTRSLRRGGWTQQRGALMPAETIKANSKVITELEGYLTFVPDASYAAKTAGQQHYVATQVPLERVLEALVSYSFEDPRDTAHFTGLLVVLGEIIRTNPNATASVYRMRPQYNGARTTAGDGTLETIQQGPTRKADGTFAYPGDTAFKDRSVFTLQLHRFDLKRSDSGPVAAVAAPLIACHLPAALAKSWIVQVQDGQDAAA